MVQTAPLLIRFPSDDEPVSCRRNVLEGPCSFLRTNMSPTSDKQTLTRANLKTPRAAAVAGVAFSVLLIAALWLLRSSIPADPLESGAWITTGVGDVALALNLIPF